jgi:hypothetical protein
MVGETAQKKKDNFQHNIGTEFSEKNILPTFDKKEQKKNNKKHQAAMSFSWKKEQH